MFGSNKNFFYWATLKKKSMEETNKIGTFMKLCFLTATFSPLFLQSNWSQRGNSIIIFGRVLNTPCVLPQSFIITYKSSPPDFSLGKSVLKICSKFTGEHPYRSCFATLLKSHFGMDVLL